MIKSYGKKILTAIWIMIFVILIGIPVLSFFHNELAGGIAFSILPAAVLLNISVVISHIIGDSSRRIVRAGWIVLSAADFVFVMIISDPAHADAYRDTEIFLYYTMLTLSFPLGFITPFLLWIAGSLSVYVFSLPAETDFTVSENVRFYGSNLILWFSFFIIGYFQWFILLPFLIKKWRSGKHDT